MTNIPKVSIHMCTYNRAQFITQAIESVLMQTYTDWELLILDDASTDTTATIIAPYLSDTRIKYIKNEINLGITKNRNKALSLSQGNYIAVLDSDDYWIDANKLERQVVFLDTKPEYVLVGTNMEIVNESGQHLKTICYFKNDFLIKNFLLLKNQFCHSSVLYRKGPVQLIDGYYESLPIWEDYDLWLQLGLTHKLANLPIIGTAYRKHPAQSDTKIRKKSLQSLSNILKKYKHTYPYYPIAYALQFFRTLRG